MERYERIYNLILDDIERRYSYLRFKDIKISDLREKTSEFQNIKNNEEFAEKLAEIIFLFKDIHFYVRINGKKKYYKGEMKKNYDESVLGNYFKSFLLENKTVKIAMAEKTPYVLVRNWWGDSKKDIEEASNKFKEILVNQKPGKIVFDVRQNGGGSDSCSKLFERLLVSEGEKVPKQKVTYTFNNATDAEKESVISIEGTLGYDGKIIALVGNECVSATESFLLFLKQKNAVLIGDKTYGGTGNPKPFWYENIEVGIPTWIVRTMDGKEVEGVGIEPDIKIPTEKSIVNGRDIVLEKALEL